MSLQVRVSERAERDVDAIFEWLGKHSPDGALRWYEAYLNSLNSLPLKAPGSASAPEAESLEADVRQVFFKTRKGRTYRLLLVIMGQYIHVVGIRGAGQANVTRNDLEFPE